MGLSLAAAVKVVKADTTKAFKRPGWDSAIAYDVEEKALAWESSGESVDMTPARIAATDYIVVDAEGASHEDAEIVGYYNTDQKRFVSTTNPEKHKAAGRKVARFVFDEMM